MIVRGRCGVLRTSGGCSRTWWRSSVIWFRKTRLQDQQRCNMGTNLDLDGISSLRIHSVGLCSWGSNVEHSGILFSLVDPKADSAIMSVSISSLSLLKSSLVLWVEIYSRVSLWPSGLGLIWVVFCAFMGPPVILCVGKSDSESVCFLSFSFRTPTEWSIGLPVQK